jgi:DNA transposition AAA+ family ATPase
MPLAEITNLRSAKRVYNYLAESKQPERTAIFFGKRGLGKSTALLSLKQEANAVYLYCLPTYTDRSFIEDILEACGLSPEKRNKTALLKQVIDYFGDTKRPLLLDDCDNITNGNLPEIARSIHDRAHNIVILAGMERFAHKLSRWPQLVDRSHLLQFQSLSLQDVKALAELTPITIESELVEKIYKASEGKARLAIRSIGYVNEFANLRELDHIGVSDWGNQSLLPNPEGAKIAA